MQLQTPPIEQIETALAVDGGFTYDPRSGEFIRAGLTDGSSPFAYAVAIPDLILDRFENDNRSVFIGGWIDPRTNRTVIEPVQFILSKEEAIRKGIERGQYSIMEMHTGNEIVLA